MYVTLACSMWAMQATAPVSDGFIDRADKLTLTAATIFAAVVLWRKTESLQKQSSEKDAQNESKLEKKDEALIAMTKTVTEALVAQTEVTRSMKQTIDQNNASFDELRDSINTLNVRICALPCSLDPQKRSK